MVKNKLLRFLVNFKFAWSFAKLENKHSSSLTAYEKASSFDLIQNRYFKEVEDLSRNIESFEAKINEVEDLYSNRKLWDVLKQVCSKQGWNFKHFLKQIFDNYYSKDELYTLMDIEMDHTLPDDRFHDFLWSYLIPKARKYITEIEPRLQQLKENYDTAKSSLKDAKDKEEAFFTGEL